jgi:hypothetical protein
MVSHAANYLREALIEKGGEQEAKRVFAGLSQELRDVVSSPNPAGWYPVSLLSEITRSVAAMGEGNEDRARAALVRMGAANARAATNTFLRLLMRMLTPTIFARKLPDFWSRDCTSGRLEVDVSDRKLVCRLFNMTGFDHVVVTTAGYVGFAIEAMGKSIEKTTINNWSLETPCVDGAWLELSWKK